MITVLILGILGGIDNLQIGSAMGLMGVSGNRLWMKVAPFVFFDVAMTLVGLLIGNRLNTSFEQVAHWLGPVFMMSMGIYILIREMREKDTAGLADKKWLLIMLPFFMSFDNLFAGLGLGTVGYPVLSSVITVGLCTGLMCFLGLLIGNRLRNFIPDKIEMISGLYLIGLAVFFAVKK